ncbi:hypothetical protein DOY81_008532 [Sarcophaga bullata]|nr:hypothetical protein DOY81_008532 [Sarcophaga bullata]
MQQMQQQIPRSGLGATGTGGIGAETKPHQCQQCMKSFSSNHQLVQHIRVHTGEKPYKCSYCDRRFKQLSHVQQHTRLHTVDNDDDDTDDNDGDDDNGVAGEDDDAETVA